MITPISVKNVLTRRATLSFATGNMPQVHSEVTQLLFCVFILSSTCNYINMLCNNANTNCLYNHESFRRCVWTFRVIICSKITKVHIFLTEETMLNLTVAFCPRKRGPDLRKQQCCRIATMIAKTYNEKVQRRQGTGHTTTGSHVASSPKQDDGYRTNRQYFLMKV